MANKHPKSRFPKGVSGNPKGRPPLPLEVRQLKQLTISQLNEVVSLVMACSYDELLKMSQDGNASVIQRMSASLALNTIAKGNTFAWNALLEQFRGKLKEKVEVSGDGLKPQVTLVFEDNGREVKKK